MLIAYARFLRYSLMMIDVRNWLHERGFEQFADVFEENEIDGEVLFDLTNDDFKDLGLPLGSRKKLLKAIERVSEPEPITELPAPAIAAGERRQVTVLFADIAGYTKLSSELGAEETHALLNRYFGAVDGIVEDYGGSIDKHMGDNVMAVFGAPIAHDDDPLRAVRAALDIHERMVTLSTKLSHPLIAHIGIASGQVVASGTGSDAHSEYTVTGDSVNLASRLQDRAAPGETLISDTVYSTVSEKIEGESLGDIAVKGLDVPVQAWRISALRVGDHGASHLAFVGRHAEIGQFTGVVEACRANSAGQAIVIRGEAGIGKTRLVDEFAAISAERGFISHRGLVLDFGVGKGQDAIRAIVRSLLEIPQDGAKTKRKAAAEAALSNGVLAVNQRVFLNDLLNLAQSIEDRSIYDAMDNATRNDGKCAVIADLIRSASAATPIVVIVEDVHWASTLMLSQLAAMVCAATDCPALLVMTSRIEGYPLDQAWRGGAGDCPLMTIDLPPLRRSEALTFADAFIDTTNQFAQDCIERAGGNPLFLEQLLRTAEERGEEEIPASIQSLVLARMDRLFAADKRALQAASVIGQRFALDELGHLLDDSCYDCAGLLDHHLVRPEGDYYLFAHALIRDGVYASLLISTKQRLHVRAAEWFADHDLVLHAEHLDRASDPGAATAYLDAAEAQTAVLHFETALRLTDRGIELAGDPVNKCDLMCLRGDTLRHMGATEESIAMFESALAVAEDDEHQCRVWIGLAEGSRIADKQESALAALDKAESAATNLNLLSDLAKIHYLRGNVYFPLGNIDGCLEEHEKALGFAREAGSTEAEALALGGLGDAYYLRGHTRSACEQFRACVEICREHGYGRIEVANRHMVGWTRIYLMEFSEALEDALECARMAANVSHHRAELLSLMLVGCVELELGRFVDAQEHLEHGLALSQTIGAGNFEAQTLGWLARLSAAQGRMPEAREFALRAVGMVRKVGVTFAGPHVLAVRAALTDDPDECRRALEEAESILDRGCVAHNHFRFAQTAIDHALAIGEWDEAERYATRLEAYTREQPMAWPNFMIARGRALAAHGRGERHPTIMQELKRLHDEAERVALKSAMSAIKAALAIT